MRRLFHVEMLRSLGLSLAQTADAIDDREIEPDVMVENVIQRVREQIVQGQDLVQRLEDVQATAPNTWDDVLHTIGLIKGLESRSPSHRQQLALKTAESDQRDVPVLVAAMLRESTEDAAGALQWAVARRGDSAIPALMHALDSADRDRRRRAFDALVKLGTVAAERAIMGLTKHEDVRIRTRAIISRAKHGKKGSISALIGLIVVGQDDIEAADVITEIALRDGKVEQVVDALAKALSTAEPEARRHLVGALKDLPYDATRETLTLCLDDEDRATALTARFILDTQPGNNRS